MMTVNIKTIQALSERSLTQYSPRLSVCLQSVLVQAQHRCTGGRMTFLSLPFSPREIVTLVSTLTLCSKVGNFQLNLQLHNKVEMYTSVVSIRNTRGETWMPALLSVNWCFMKQQLCNWLRLLVFDRFQYSVTLSTHHKKYWCWYSAWVVAKKLCRAAEFDNTFQCCLSQC